MEKELLTLIPEWFLCPHCGNWHKWKKPHKLSIYSSRYCICRLECEKPTSEHNELVPTSYEIYFEDNKIHCSAGTKCERYDTYMYGETELSSIEAYSNLPSVTFDIEFMVMHITTYTCKTCRKKKTCVDAITGDEVTSRHLTLRFGFEFLERDYEMIAKQVRLNRKEQALIEWERNLNEREKALSRRESSF